MEIKLKVKPKNPTIIEGFPGIGLIGTISTEYLIKHLNAKSIGYIRSEDIAPVAAVHEGKLIQPLELFYSKSKNILIVHSLVDIRGIEWEISEVLSSLYKTLKAKEIISIEGIVGQAETEVINAYYYSVKKPNDRKLSKANALPLKEGVLMGVTAALMLQDKTLNTTGIFVETHSKLPDSRAAAKVIEVLAKYLNLKVDYKPLEKAAEEFEKKLQDYAGKLQDVTSKTDKKNQKRSYFG